MININIEKKMMTYQGSSILKVDTQIGIGSITEVYGPSGVGKTTFFKVLAGLVAPEKGKIIFNGQLWQDTETKFNLPAQKRMVGFVFQNYALFPNMTVIQQLRYATKDEQWIARLLRLGRLETLLSHKPEYLSGGQQQRLAILRALAIKPRVLLMDEPFSALDREMRTIIIKELKQLISEWNCTCLVVSHDFDNNFGNERLKIG